MTDRDQMPDWDDLKDLWQQGPNLDMERMARQARFVWWRMRINFVLEILLCTIGVGFMGHFMWSDPTLARLTFGGLMTAFCVFGVWAAFWVRAGAWDSADGTALSLIRLQIERAYAGIRYVKINLWAFAVSFPVLGGGAWAVLTQEPPPSDRRITFLIAFCLGYLVMAFVFWLVSRGYVKRKRREIEDLSEAEAQLKASDD